VTAGLKPSPSDNPLEFEDVVFNGEADVAVGLRQAANGFGLVDLALSMTRRRGRCGRTLDGLHGGFAIDVAGGHENADAALTSLEFCMCTLTMRSRTRSPPGHCAVVIMLRIIFWQWSLHAVEPEITSGHVRDDADVGCAGDRGLVIAGDGGVLAPRRGHRPRRRDIGGAAGGGDSNDDIFPVGRRRAMSRWQALQSLVTSTAEARA